MAGQLHSARRRRWRNTGAVLAGLVALTGVLALVLTGTGNGADRAGLYSPERQALVEARWQLSRTVEHGRPAPEPLAPDAADFTRVLAWLQQAGDSSPDDRRRIEHVEAMIRNLQQAEQRSRDAVSQRTAVYREINEELQQLISGATRRVGPGTNDSHS